ncbi:MAG TPA: substrate-binding domain-containing protein [Xanthobacteraceae bacterium]|nr:substrate-binding domain-containing protein [Xanthobacteraceae bacterium]
MRRLIVATSLMAALSLASVETARAEDLKVLASVALSAVLRDLAPDFEKATGNKLNISFGLAVELKKRVLDGEAADVIIVTRSMLDDLQKANRLAADSLANVAGTPVSVAARSGAPKPDISSVEAFKRALLGARSVVYSDPAKGGVSGVHFARVIDRLGIAEQMKAKTILVPGAEAAEVVARGEAELGIAQGSEIVPVAGAEWIGPLPGELASTTVFAAAVGAATKSPEAAQSLIRFLTGVSAAPRLKAKGFEPA